MQTISAEIIYRGERARPLLPANVQRLMSSIEDVGLLNPIIVRPVRRFHKGMERDVYEIVTGCHRFEAVRNLGWTDIVCKVIETLDDLHVEMAEIDENLMRANLSPAQEASAMARRKEIYETLHPETRHGSNQHMGGVAENATPRFTAATAEATGKGERTVQLAVQRGRELGDDLALIAGTSLDRAGELDALGKLEAEERRNLIERARAGEKVTAKKPPKVAADPLDDTMASERQVARLMDAWNAAGPDAREEFLCRIDAPVMDKGRFK